MTVVWAGPWGRQKLKAMALLVGKSVKCLKRLPLGPVFIAYREKNLTFPGK